MNGLARIILRARAAHGIVLDRVRQGDADGRLYEIVDPPWWNLKRQWVRLFGTHGYTELTLFGADGMPHYFRVRIRYLAPEPPRSILIDGRRLQPHPVSLDYLDALSELRAERERHDYDVN
jgi:hypothetical protein